jgi:actin-binding protein IPP
MTISQENVQDLMVAADMLELKEVVNGCTEYLKNELHITNAIGIYRYISSKNKLFLLQYFVYIFNKGFFVKVC